MKKFYYILPIVFFSSLLAQDEDEDVNLDDLWDTTVWEEIEEINEVEGEVEQVEQWLVFVVLKLRMQLFTIFTTESL